MQIIEFSVINQRIRCESETGIIENSRGLAYASFVFDEEWDGCGLEVLFSNPNYNGDPIPQAWTGKPILIPEQVLVDGRLVISCVGVRDAGAYRIPTYEMTPGVRVYRSGPLVGVVPETVTPSMVEQLMAAAATALAAAETAQKTADDLAAARDAGEFNGPQGEPGFVHGVAALLLYHFCRIEAWCIRYYDLPSGCSQRRKCIGSCFNAAYKHHGNRLRHTVVAFNVPPFPCEGMVTEGMKVVRKCIRM